MENLSEKVLETLSLIERRPGMFMIKPDFNSLENYLIGYLHGLKTATGKNLFADIQNWIPEVTAKKTGAVWTRQILHFLAGDDEEKGYRLLLEYTRRYFVEHRI